MRITSPPAFIKLRRIRVISTRKSTPNLSRLIRLLNLHHNTISTSHHDKNAQRDKQRMHPKHNFLSKMTLAIIHMIMHPQPSRQRNRQRSKANTSGEGKQIFKDRNCFSEDKGDDAEAKCAGEPGYPVDEGVGLEVVRVAEEAHEDVFGGDVEVEAGADD
jgi:hypothetical protein